MSDTVNGVHRVCNIILATRSRRCSDGAPPSRTMCHGAAMEHRWCYDEAFVELPKHRRRYNGASPALRWSIVGLPKHRRCRDDEFAEPPEHRRRCKGASPVLRWTIIWSPKYRRCHNGASLSRQSITGAAMEYSWVAGASSMQQWSINVA